MNGDRRFELPEELTPQEERAVLTALERYFRRESPRPHPWVLAGRLEATGFGALQARRYADRPWDVAGRVRFTRTGVPPLHGRGDAG